MSIQIPQVEEEKQEVDDISSSESGKSERQGKFQFLNKKTKYVQNNWSLMLKNIR